MKVADYVIWRLAGYGIDRVFLVYGAANGDLVDAFTRTEGADYVACMHEQAAGFAAEGYAKVKGIPGCAIATSGPGGMNLLTPMGNCFYDSVPCVFLTGQINSRFLRPDPSLRQVGFQETDIVAMARPVTKLAVMVIRPEDIRYELERALWTAMEGRPGPVLLDLPLDVQKAEIDPERLVGFEEPRATWNLTTLDEQILELMEDLHRAERPALLIGGGVRHPDALEALGHFAHELRVPCFPTWNALDVVTSEFSLYGGRVGTYGGAGRNFGIQNADLLVAIGCRISGRITGGAPETFARAAKKYVVDVDPALLQPKLQQVRCDVNVRCDAAVFMFRLLEALQAERRRGTPVGDRSGWLARVMEWKRRYDPVRPEHFEQDRVHPYAFCRRLSELLPANAIVVTDCGGNVVTMNHAFETKAGQRYFSNNGNSPMGFSFAAAMGAWFAAPSRPVVCVIGDGGFNMNLQELQTFVNYGVKVKTFILNNHIYGITKAFQETNFEGRAEACGPKGYSPPDFLRIAEAYGVQRATLSHSRFTDAVVADVMAWPAAVVCDVDVDEHHTYEPRLVGWDTPIEDMSPKLPRDEFLANMIVEPLPQSRAAGSME